MCCRFFIEESSAVQPYGEAAARSPLKEQMESSLGRRLVCAGEVRPGDLAPVLAPSKQQTPRVYPMLWGFRGRDLLLINARCESAAQKSSFRESWALRRCAVPASGYFEWDHPTTPEGRKKTGDKYAIRPRNGGILFLAGLYRLEEQQGLRIPVFTVLTREPTEALRRIHDRMPVLLPESSISAWLRPDSRPEAVLETAVEDLKIERA